MINTLADRELPHAIEQIIRAEAYRALTLDICPDDFEDLCQEGRIEVFRKRGKIVDAENEDAFCREVVRNRMANWLKSQRRHSDHQVPIPDGL